MSVIYLLILISLAVAIIFLVGFFWAVKDGQYEDDYSSSLRAGDHDGFVLYISPELDIIFKNGFE